MKKLRWSGLILLALLPLAVGCSKQNPAAPDNIPGLAKTPTPETETVIKIDDCEDLGNANELNSENHGYWYTFTDGSSTVIPDPSAFTKAASPWGGAPDPLNPATNTSGYVHMAGSVVGASGFIAVGTSLVPHPDSPENEVINLTQYTGVAFYVKGDGSGRQYRLNLKSGNITDSNYFGVDFTPTLNWTRIQCDFLPSVFKQQNWGPPSPPIPTLQDSLTQAKALAWQAPGNVPSATVDLYVDEIFFYK